MGGGLLVQKRESGGAVASAPSAQSALPDAAAGVTMAVQGGNPLAVAHKWVTEKQERFQAWLEQQNIPVEAALTTGLAAIQGGLLGGLISTLGKDLQAVSPKNAALGLESNQANPFLSPEGVVASPLVQARNFAVLTGMNAGVSCVLKRIRGVDDVQNSMAAAFSSGFAFSLVSSPGSLNIVNAVGTGAFFALLQGGLYKIMPKGTKSSNEDVYYAQTRTMLMKLGLERYEKNFRNGLLVDTTLPLLTDSALREVGIPPGPRLVIVDYVQRNSEFKKLRR